MCDGLNPWVVVVSNLILSGLSAHLVSLIVLRYWGHRQSPASKNSNGQEAK